MAEIVAHDPGYGLAQLMPVARDQIRREGSFAGVALFLVLAVSGLMCLS